MGTTTIVEEMGLPPLPDPADVERRRHATERARAIVAKIERDDDERHWLRVNRLKRRLNGTGDLVHEAMDDRTLAVWEQITDRKSLSDGSGR